VYNHNNTENHGKITAFDINHSIHGNFVENHGFRDYRDFVIFGCPCIFTTTKQAYVLFVQLVDGCLFWCDRCFEMSRTLGNLVRLQRR